MSWVRRTIEKLTGSPPPALVDPLQEEARRRIDAVVLHGTHAPLGQELGPEAVACGALDVAAFVSARDHRRPTTNVLVLPELAGDAVLLAVFDGNYKHGATALACSLVASALCDAFLAAPPDADAEATLRRAFADGCTLLGAMADAGPPDDIWSEVVRTEVLGDRPGWRGLGLSVTAAFVSGNDVTLAHVGETEGHRRTEDGTWERLTPSHLLADEPRFADVEDKSSLAGVVARILMATGADLEILRATLAPGDTLVLATPSVARRLSDALPASALEAAKRCLGLAGAEPIPAAAVIARRPA